MKEHTLISIRETNLTISDPDADVRGSKVVDKDNREVGDVDDLLIDEKEAKVRFLRVGAGGFLGFGEKKLYIPVDAVTDIDQHRTVHINRDREQMAQAPSYDPQLDKRPKWEDVYAAYGFVPYWSAGYVPAAFPYYPVRNR